MEMTPFHAFLNQLLNEGKIVFRSAVGPRDQPSAAAIATLTSAFDTYSLDVAGPRIPFDAEVACAAAEFVRQSSWALVNREEPMKDLDRRLKMPHVPRTPSHHLSADLTLRHLPQILRRARALDPADPLIGRITDVLLRWPLSGVLSDLDEGPLGPLQLGRHPGLLLLYAERLARNDRPAWRPERSSPVWEYHELVTQEQAIR